MAKKKVVDMIPEVVDSPEVESTNVPTRCEVVAGIKENGDVYFGSRGESVDLITIEGLLNYARQELDRYWEARAMQQAQEAMRAQQEAAE